MAHGEADARARDGQKILDDRLTQLVHDRQTLSRDAKLGIILLAVLFLLNREYTPLVAADYQIENRLGAQVRTLVLLQGHLDRLTRIVTAGFVAWEQRANARIDGALQKVVELDAYNERLKASSRNERPDVPEFVRACAAGETEPERWLQNPSAPGPWEEIVEACVIAPIDADPHAPTHDSLAIELNQARDDVNAVLVQARDAFQLPPPEAVDAPVPGPAARQSAAMGLAPDDAPEVDECPTEWERLIAPTGHPRQSSSSGSAATPAVPAATPATPAATPIAALPTSEPTEPAIPLATPAAGATPTLVPLDQTLEDIAWQVNWTAQIFSRPVGDAVCPVAEVWWDYYSGPDGSLRTFRDNMLLHLAGLGGPTQTQRSATSSRREGDSTEPRTLPASFSPRADLSVGLTGVTLQPLLGDLAGTLTSVREQQERLQADIAMQTSELEAAIPDFAKPVLAVAQPKYLVLSYPLLVAGVAVYLMTSYTVLKDHVRQWRREYGTPRVRRELLDVGLAEPPGLMFGALVGAPLLLLGFLRWSNDWPQLLDGEWNWVFWAAVGLVLVVAVGCLLYLERPSTATSTASPPTPRPAEPPRPAVRVRPDDV